MGRVVLSDVPSQHVYRSLRRLQAKQEREKKLLILQLEVGQLRYQYAVLQNEVMWWRSQYSVVPPCEVENVINELGGNGSCITPGSETAGNDHADCVINPAQKGGKPSGLNFENKSEGIDEHEGFDHACRLNLDELQGKAATTLQRYGRGLICRRMLNTMKKEHSWIAGKFMPVIMETTAVETSGDVPELQVAEEIVEAPQVQTVWQERTNQVPVPQVQTFEKIVVVTESQVAPPTKWSEKETGEYVMTLKAAFNDPNSNLTRIEAYKILEEGIDFASHRCPDSNRDWLWKFLDTAKQSLAAELRCAHEDFSIETPDQKWQDEAKASLHVEDESYSKSSKRKPRKRRR